MTYYPPLDAVKQVDAQYPMGGRLAYWFFWPAFQLEQVLLPGMWELPPDALGAR